VIRACALRVVRPGGCWVGMGRELFPYSDVGFAFLLDWTLAEKEVKDADSAGESGDVGLRDAGLSPVTRKAGGV